MKKYIFISLLFTTNLYAEKITLPNDVRFQSTSKVEATKSFTGKGMEQISSIKEEGKIGQVGYSIYHSDASAAFDAEPNALANIKRDLLNGSQTWSVSCKQNPMTDKKTCSIINNEANLFILKSIKGIEGVSVLGSEYPGTKPQLRVGNAKALSAEIFTGNQAKKIFNSFKPGVQVRTQYYDWPYHASKEGKTTIYGLRETMLYVDWVLNGNQQTSTRANSSTVAPPSKNSSDANGHSHGGRYHSHPLPKEGVKHRHGNGEIGR